MIKGIGTDIIEISRIEKALKRQGEKFLHRLFTKNEQAYCLKHQKSERHFAGRFAAKEAIIKAASLSSNLSWIDFEILNDARGKPYVVLSNVAKDLLGESIIEISISHCKNYATAVAIVYTDSN